MIYVGGAAPMRLMGAYSGASTYYPNDVVSYGGSSYIATATTNGSVPTNTTYWQPLALAPSSGYAASAKFGSD